MKLSQLIIGIGLIGAMVMASCAKDGTPGINQTGKMQVRMTDAPGDYDAVLIDVKDVLVSYVDGDSGWVSIGGIRPGIYNLLDLTNGFDTLIASGEVPVGKIKHLRLLLGPDNSIVVNGNTFALKTPSAEQSGLKIKLDEQLVSGSNLIVKIDFDAAKSVVERGNGEYLLKPVLRIIKNKDVGVISGIIEPNVDATVYAVLQNDTVATYVAPSGGFVLQGLDPGMYQVVIVPQSDSGFSSKTVNNVGVDAGKETKLGTISL